MPEMCLMLSMITSFSSQKMMLLCLPISSTMSCLVRRSPISSRCSIRKFRIRSIPGWVMERIRPFWMCLRSSMQKPGAVMGLVLFLAVRKASGKGSRSRQGEPVLAAVVFYGKKQLVRLRLGDLVDPPARERIGKLFADRCNGNAVKCHDVSSFLKKIRTVSSIPARPSAHKSFLTGSALCFIIK